MAFARRQFELSAPQGDGQPLIAHLQSVQKQTGRVHEMIAEAPPLPAGCSQLWDDFLELHNSRGAGLGGAMRITFADMDAWQRVRGAHLQPWEVDCLLKADSMWLSEFAPKPKADG